MKELEVGDVFTYEANDGPITCEIKAVRVFKGKRYCSGYNDRRQPFTLVIDDEILNKSS